MTVDSLVQEMVEAAANYPGIDHILYRTLVEGTATLVSMFIGIVAVSLSVGIPIILAIELAFINFPVLTDLLRTAEEHLAAAGVEKKRMHWGLFINDARKALRIHAEEQRSINLCYLRVKWVTLVTGATSISILFAGQDTIVSMVTKVISPILLRVASM